MNNRTVICLQCPKACKIYVAIENEKVVHLDGHICKRGEVYAIQEVESPARILTSTLKIITEDAEHPLLPVRTSAPIPKDLLFEAMHLISGVVVEAPVYYGQIVIKNILDTGINVLSTAEVLK